MRARAGLIFDARTNTEFGTLRAYTTVGSTKDTLRGGVDPAAFGVIFSDRAFIQFAGFTFGRAASFFDFFSSTGPYANMVTWNGMSPGALGWNVLAYTAQFGGGWSASVSLEDRRVGKSIWRNDTAISPGLGVTAGTPTPFASATSRAGQRFPALIGNIRLDQSWGSAQIMGVLQEVRGTYDAFPGAGADGPGDKTGWAVGGGFTWNEPFGAPPGSQFGIQVAYAEGATSYTAHTFSNVAVFSGPKLAIAHGMDAVFEPGGGLHLTRSWGVNTGYQHRFNPQWAWSIHGGYTSFRHGQAAKDVICDAIGPGGFNPITGQGGSVLLLDQCDPNFSFWSIGSRLLWTPVSDLNIGVDVIYHHYNTAHEGTAEIVGPGGIGSRGPGDYIIGDNGVFTAQFRVQRNF